MEDDCMFQKFFTSTIMSKFVKNLLYSEPIPLLKCIDTDDYIIENCLYIYKDYIIKCVSSGNMKVDLKTLLYPGDELYPSDDIEPHDGKVLARWKVVGYYNADNRQYNYTYKSVTSYYDSDTHKHLGNYLRFLRDRKGLNLMHLYNCYNYSTIEDVYLNYVPVESGDYSISVPAVYPSDTLFPKESLYPTDAYEIEVTSGNTAILYPNYNLYPDNTLYPGTYKAALNKPSYGIGKSTSTKLLAIPIKFNQTYTIAVECPTRVIMRSIIYGSSGMTRLNYKSDAYYSDYLNDTYSIKLSSKFNQPFTYRVDLETLKLKDGAVTYDALYNHEQDLYLVIQLPTANKSSVVVLEGDYTNLGAIETDVNSVRQYKIHKNLSLLRLDTHETYAFSDRLIEYLLNNVITHLDELTDNIDRAQTALANAEETYARLSARSAISMGVWDDGLKHATLRMIEDIENDIYLQDQDGYINKDIENVLYRRGVYST